MSNDAQGHQPRYNPALLAFIKCHVTSFITWDLLCKLSERSGTWIDGDKLAQELNLPKDRIVQPLLELASEGVIEQRRAPHGTTAYRLAPDEPTTTVIERLLDATQTNEQLRRIVVRRITQRASSELPRMNPVRPVTPSEVHGREDGNAYHKIR